MLLSSDRTLARRAPRKSLRARRGASAVELALCIPILVLVLLATIEACVMLQLQQNVTVTAYEGARVGILPGSDASRVQLQCEMLMNDRNVQGYSVSMLPGDPAALQPGDDFTVTVEADCASNSMFGGVFYEDRKIRESVVLRAE
ncbi:MAG: TadE family protein [Planctomycetota bacterium]